MNATRLSQVGAAFCPLLAALFAYWIIPSFKTDTGILIARCLPLGVALIWLCFYLIAFAVVRTRFLAVLFGVALANSLLSLWILYFDPLHRIRTLFAG
jgi:hypothetical protein